MIPLDVVLNLILVKERIRPAMLLQPANYNESSSQDPITQSILEKIQHDFRGLTYSEKYTPYQGIIIGHENYTGEISGHEMGLILGYPCANDYDNMNGDKYTIDLVANVKGSDVVFYTNVCNHANKHVFNTMVRQASRVFNYPKYKLGNVSVSVKTTRTITISALVHKIMTDKHLSKEEHAALMNVFYNIGFDIDWMLKFEDTYKSFNPIHKGLVIGLLLNSKNDVLHPFAPLQNTGKDDQVTEIIQQWGKDILQLLGHAERRKTRRVYSV